MKRTVNASESLRLAGRFHRGDEQSARIIQTLGEKTSYFFNTYLNRLYAKGQKLKENPGSPCVSPLCAEWFILDWKAFPISRGRLFLLHELA